MKTYKKKFIVSGGVIEEYTYENEVAYNFKDNGKKRTGRSSVASYEDIELNREKVFNRAKRDLRRIINANIEPYSKFLTLTFRDDMEDIQACNNLFKKFIKRLNYNLGIKVKYSCVPEIQNDRYKVYGVAVWHYHVVLYNLTQKVDVNKVADIWSHGFIKINIIDDCDNVGAYVCKYMTKTKEDRLKGQKMYFSSRGLNKPIEIKEPELVDALAGSLQTQTLTYENTFSNEYNSINYKQYNMNTLIK